MNVFLFLKGELRQSKGVFFGLTVLLALALAVAVSVIQTERMVKSSTIRAAEQFDILVGARGSRSALLLGTVYLRDEMLSLVPMQVLDNLSPKTSDLNWAAPLAFGRAEGILLNFINAEIADVETDAPCGTILSDRPSDGLIVACGQGAVRVTEVQPAGGKKMRASVFLNGRKLKKGMRFEDKPVL